MYKRMAAFISSYVVKKYILLHIHNRYFRTSLYFQICFHGFIDVIEHHEDKALK